jgi:hypothetical protein
MLLRYTWYAFFSKHEYTCADSLIYRHTLTPLQEIESKEIDSTGLEIDEVTVSISLSTRTSPPIKKIKSLNHVGLGVHPPS